MNFIKKLWRKLQNWTRIQEELERTKKEADEETLKKINSGEVDWKNYVPD